MFLLPEPNGERTLSSLCGFYLDHRARKVALEHTAKGALALVVLAGLELALVVNNQNCYSERPERLYMLHKEAYGISGGFGVALHGYAVRVENQELYTVLLTKLCGGLEGFPARTPDGAHIEKVLRRFLHTSTAAELIDTPGLLFGVELEVQVEYGATFHRTPKPATGVFGNGYSKRQSKQTLGYTTVTVEESYISRKYETLQQILSRSGWFHVRQFDQFRLPSPSLTPIEGRGRGR